MQALLFALAAAACPQEPGSEPAPPQGPPAPHRHVHLHPEESLRIGHGLAASGNDEAARSTAYALRTRAERGSPVWFEAAGLEARALWELWDPGATIADPGGGERDVSEAIEELAREVRAALEDRAGEEAESRLGPELPVAAVQGVQDVEIASIFLRQARGDHDGASRELEPIVADFLAGLAPPSYFMLQAPVACARGHLLAGRTENARAILSVLRDAQYGTAEAAVGTVLLQELDGDGAYRGVYEGDEAHAARVERLRARIPWARARVAELTGLGEEALEGVVVGVADWARDRHGEGAVTNFDERRPSLAPVVIVYAQWLAAGPEDAIDRALLHELVHAACLSGLGHAYSRLPRWIVEGIAYELADDVDEYVESAVASTWLEHQCLLDEREARAHLRPHLAHPPRNSAQTYLASAALGALEEEAGPGAVRRLIGALGDGKSLAEALDGLVGLTPEAFRARAEEHVLARALAALEEARPFLPAFERARASRDPAERAAAAAEVLAGDPPGFLSAWTRSFLAGSLADAGRFEEALAAADALLAGPARELVHVWHAKVARGRALGGLGRREEAREVLEEARVLSMAPGAVAVVDHFLREVDARAAPPSGDVPPAPEPRGREARGPELREPGREEAEPGEAETHEPDPQEAEPQEAEPQEAETQEAEPQEPETQEPETQEPERRESDLREPELPRVGEPAPPEMILGIAHMALREGELEVAANSAGAARAGLERGTPAWFEAAGLEARARYQLWSPDDLSRIATEVQIELARRHAVHRDDPAAGTLPEAAMVASQDATILGVYVRQARGDHERAARMLEPYLFMLLAGEIPATALALQAPIACAESLLLAGREERARTVLSLARDGLRGTLSGALATVLLQGLGAGADEYRGAYAGDPEHAERMEAVRARAPAARRKAARALGVDEALLDPVRVGVADVPSEHPTKGGIAVHDPRRPAIPPIVCLYSHALVGRSEEEIERDLVHELVHAACSTAIGLEYWRLPDWVHDGIAFVAAGQVDDLVELAVAKAWWANPAAFRDDARGHARALRPILAIPPLGWGDEDLRHVGIEVLERDVGPGTIRTLVAELAGGRSYEEALREAADLEPDELRERAEEHARDRALAYLEPCQPYLARLEEARSAPSDFQRVSIADDLLDRDPPPFVRSWARLIRAQSLQSIGRYEDALEEYERMLADPEKLSIHAVNARLGRAICLAGAGSTAEGRRLLEGMRRGAVTPDVRQAVEKALADIDEREAESGGR